MDETGTHQVTPSLRETDGEMPARPWIDRFSSGYMQRMMHRFPKQGDREPWINPQDYSRDKKMMFIESGAATMSEYRYLSADTPLGDWKVLTPRRESA
jgi:hypothetical protein